MFQRKASSRPLPEGSFVHGIERGGKAEKVRLTFRDGQAKAEELPEEA